MGLSPFKSAPSTGRVILGPDSERVNASFDKNRNVPC